MKVIYSLIFDIITDPLGLPISWICEYIILLVVGAIAYKIAWNVSPGGLFGSEIHWFVRILAFIVIWAIIYAVIWTVKLIVAHWVTVICILGGILLISAIITYVVRRKLN
ncbi:MAG: hypothetical protein IJ002_05605 [Clostridia bacterium]|nr:hypothetical protein [Clostridia bacterium]